MWEPPVPPTFVNGFHDDFLISKMEYRKLGNTDMVISKVAISTEGFESLQNVDPEEIYIAKETIRLSLKGGINFFDTSPYYGEGFSENLLGEFLKDYPRNAYYIGTKIGRYSKKYEDMFDFSSKKTKESVQLSLERLQVKYIDLVTIQDIEFIRDLNATIRQILPTLQLLKKQKLIRYIGISSYSIDKIREFITLAGPGQISVVICNTRLTFFDHSLLSLLTFLINGRIGIIAGQINAKGLLTSNKVDNESINSHPANRELKQRISSAVLRCREGRTDLEKLVTYYVAQHSEIDVCLVEVTQPYQLKQQYDAVLHPLKTHEKPVYKALKDDILKKRSNWEDTEVQMYTNWLENRFKIPEGDGPNVEKTPAEGDGTKDSIRFSKDANQLIKDKTIESIVSKHKSKGSVT